MITVRLDGYSGKIGALISGEVTATGTVVRLHGPLADALNHAFSEPDIEAHVRKAIAENAPDVSVDRLVGWVMASTKGKGNPDRVRDCVKRLRGA